MAGNCGKISVRSSGRLKRVLYPCLAVICLVTAYTFLPPAIVSHWTVHTAKAHRVTNANTAAQSKPLSSPLTPKEKTGSQGNFVRASPDLPIKNKSSSSVCPFPEQNPWDPLIMKHFKKEPDIDCSSGLPSLVFMEGNFLKVNKTKAKLRNVIFDRCYYVISALHDTSDSRLKQFPWSVPFIDSIQIENWAEFVVAKCYNGPKMVSVSYLSRIIKKDSTEKNCEEKYKRHLEQNSPKETLSIALIGIDGTSRQNAYRSMPETVKFLLNDLGALELRKFNKVGDNTFVNIVPLMTGLHEPELFARNWTFNEPFDKVDHLFLWGPYQDAGYRTGMLVDHEWITAFHYLKRGWVHPPFDYYHRPIVLEMAKDQKTEDKNECVGDTPEATLLLDYWIQLFSTFNNSKTTPYFVYNFIVKLTHDFPNKATQADKMYLEFFKTLSQRKVLDNTVLVFFSDHGSRYGYIRHTPSGTLESNTPFVFFVFPRWFEAKYPQVMATFHTNQDRLSTQFDIYETLKELLYFKGTSGKGNLQSRGISLFQEIPLERTCDHADIPYQYCMCSKKIDAAIPTSLSNQLANAVLEHTVNKTAQLRNRCDVFKLSSIVSVTSTASDDKCEKCLYFQMAIAVVPGEAVFEASVRHDSASGVTIVMGDAIRITKYGHQADCIDDPQLRQYCYCYNYKA